MTDNEPFDYEAFHAELDKIVPEFLEEEPLCDAESVLELIVMVTGNLLMSFLAIGGLLGGTSYMVTKSGKRD